MNDHTCHAYGCETRTAPRMFMCRPHWRMVPEHLRRAIWATYRPGQERDKSPSWEYLEAALEACNAVAELERQATT